MNEYQRALFEAEKRKRQSPEWTMHRGQGLRIGNDMDALPEIIEHTRVEKLACVSIYRTPRTIDFCKHPYELFPVENADHLRWCSHCSSKRGWLHIDAFSADTSRRLGTRRYCKKCEADKAKKRRNDIREQRWYNGLRKQA